MVHALGLGEYQVGRSHECDYPEQVLGLPVCTRPKFDVTGNSAEIDRLVRETLASAGSVYDVFTDVLESLQPTHILTQSQCRVCAVTLGDVERSLSENYSTRPRVVALEPYSLPDVWNDFRRVAEACGIASRGEALVASLQARMAEISRSVEGSGQPTLACIEWVEPLMPAGNWTPALIEMAGARNVVWHTWEELRAADPDIMVVAPCGFDVQRTRGEMHWLEARPGWNELKAVRSGRVHVADGNQFFNRPGPRVVETLEILAGFVTGRLS